MPDTCRKEDFQSSEGIALNSDSHSSQISEVESICSSRDFSSVSEDDSSLRDIRSVFILPHPSEDQHGLEKVDDGMIQSESMLLMAKPFHTKSEVISSRTINVLTKTFLVVLLCAAFIAMIMVMLILTVWGVRYEIDDFEF
eukprot:CAMPEP_0184737558 /NCGR_PEP_ID=MMETSP0315-20130426/360_1 /TAXON_ID=101924 /ORGANISM="Rhodosorus marinus, Strain UTEX LB 2760" /LENGTH=140 /DNA_ID=CAMNT_0027204827 /DNA_START=220 /DNA_END=639 /DNA_ORIENTATION=-